MSQPRENHVTKEHLTVGVDGEAAMRSRTTGGVGVDISQRRPIPGVRAICGGVKPPRRYPEWLQGIVSFWVLSNCLATRLSPWLGFALFFAIFATFTTWWLILLPRARRQFREHHQRRIRRLENLRAAPGGFNKLPHRSLELWYLENAFARKPKRHNQLMLPPGPAIVIGAKPSQSWLTDISPVISEPTMVPRDVRPVIANWLDRWGRLPHHATKNRAVTEELQAHENRLRRRAKRQLEEAAFEHRWHAWWLNGFFVAIALLVVYTILIQIFPLPFSNMSSTFVGIAGLLVLVLAIALGIASKPDVVLAPAAIVRIRGWFRRRNAQAIVWTPAEARLVLNVVENFGDVFLATRSKIVRIKMNRENHGCMIALSLYWAANTKPPSTEALESYFGEGFDVERV